MHDKYEAAQDWNVEWFLFNFLPPIHHLTVLLCIYYEFNRIKFVYRIRFDQFSTYSIKYFSIFFFSKNFFNYTSINFLLFFIYLLSILS